MILLEWKNKTFVLGLTGGLGAGKSTVTRLFGLLGAITLQADQLAHAVLEKEEIQSRLKEAFGANVVAAGHVERTLLASRAFASPEQLKRLNSIIHPEVRLAFEEIRQSLQDGSLLVYEVPLLFEAGLEGDFDQTVTVTAAENLRYERVKNRNGWTRAEFNAREASQLALSEKEKRADFIIRNEGSQEELQEQVQDIYQSIMNRKPK